MADTDRAANADNGVARFRVMREVIAVLRRILSVWTNGTAIHPEHFRAWFEADPRRIDALLLIAVSTLHQHGHGKRTLDKFNRIASLIMEEKGRK